MVYQGNLDSSGIAASSANQLKHGWGNVADSTSIQPSILPKEYLVSLAHTNMN
jgi:hypothetical protein